MIESPSRGAALLTVLTVTRSLSLSAIVADAVSFGLTATLMPGSLAVMPVSVTTTVSARPSATASSITGMLSVAVVDPPGIVIVPLGGV